VSSPAIKLLGLSKTYRVSRKAPGLAGALRGFVRRDYVDRSAVRDLTFEVGQGEFVGLIGPNGAGKTTTLKMLSGVLHPTSGEAFVLGHVPWRRSPAFLEQIGFVMGQKGQLWWELPAWDTFLLIKEMYGLETAAFRDRVAELSASLGVRDLLDVQVRKLSLGERMKCELIAALLHRPSLIFLDEPTIGLDIASQRAVREFLRMENATRRTTIVLTSHQIADIEQLCRRVIVISSGEVIHDGSLASLRARLGDKRLVRITPKLSARAEEVRACREWLTGLALKATGGGRNAGPGGAGRATATGQAARPGGAGPTPAEAPPDLAAPLLDEGGVLTLRLPGRLARLVAAEALSHPAVEDVELREPPLEEAVAALFAGAGTPSALEPGPGGIPDREPAAPGDER